jgi:RNA polymerase sigma-70 factor (ECF subfamily)
MHRGGWFRHTDRKITPEMLPLAATPVGEDRLDLTMAVMNLPAKFRETIMLYYYQDMDTMEISKTLGIAQSSVSNRLRKGRELLCKALEGRDLHA